MRCPIESRRAPLAQLLAALPGIAALGCAAAGTAAAAAAAAAGVPEADGAATAAAVAAAAVAVPAYVPGPVEVGWEIWVGAAAGVIPFGIGAYEFGKRILIQRRCAECGGSGLVLRGGLQRKCRECGGFFPWVGWSQFLSATAQPGNGGALRPPRGQTSIFYKVPPRPEAPPPEVQSTEPLDSGELSGPGQPGADELISAEYLGPDDR